MWHGSTGAFVLAVVVAGAMGVGAYAQDGAPDSGLSGEISLGLISPLTGDIAQYGEENLAATRLAISDFNEYLAGKDAGWSINVVVEDTQTLPTVALEKLQSLRSKDIRVVLGPVSSASLQNVKGYADANGMLLFSCCSTSPLLAISGDTIFRMSPDDSNAGIAMGKILEDAGIDVIVPVWREDAWGVGIESASRESFTSRGGTVDDGLGYSPEVSEFSAETSILADRVQGYVDEYGADNVGVLYMGFGEVLPFMQAASIHDILGDVRWFGTDANTKMSSLVEDPIGLQFVTYTGYTTTLVTSGKNDLSKHVEESLDAEIGRIPTTYASSAYDAAWVVALAIEREQSTDVAALVEAIPEVAAGYAGALGPIRLNDAGDLIQTNYDVWTISDGAWAVVGSYLAATDTIKLDDAMADDKTMAKPALDGTVQIGGLVTTTGAASNSGADVAVAVALAESDFNKYLQENGMTWTLDVLIEDTATDPGMALDLVAGFDARGINVVVGPYSSAELGNIREYVDSNGMLALSYGSTAPSLAIAGDNILRFVADDRTQAPAAARYLEDIGITNIVPIWRGDPWGDGLSDAIRAEFTAAGGIADGGVRYAPDAADFAADALVLSERVASNIGAVGADRVAVIALPFNEFPRIIHSASQHEPLSQVLWLTTDTVVSSVNLLDDPVSKEFIDATGMTMIGLDLPSNPTQDEVGSKIEAINGGAPARYAFYAYDTVWIAGLSILAAGSAETDAVMAAIPGVLEDYSGAAGTFTLNDAGDLDSVTYSIFRLQDFEFVAIETFDPASGSFAPVDAMTDDKESGDAMTDDKESGDAMSKPDDAESPGGGCLIATAAYGSELAPQVQFLREIRDNTLLSTDSGTSFMTGFNQFYYSFSPAIADLERESVVFRDAVRVAITPALYTLNIMTLADQGSDGSVIAFGLLAIAAMAGIYVAGPVLAVRTVGRKVRNRHS